MNILLAVSGSISAYKAFDITRGLIKSGHSVKVVLTAGALNFLKPELFRYLGALEVHNPQSDFENNTNGMNHINLARWCDRLIIAPLTANTLAQLSSGQAFDLLSCLFLALGSKTPIIVYPAMNTQMYTHPLVEKNIQILRELKNVTIIDPDRGVLACGEEGIGKLPSVEKICSLCTFLGNPKKKSPRNILITTGATISVLDSVRYLTNESSGTTGFILAKNFLAQGDNVTVLAGKKSCHQLEYLNDFENFVLKRIISTEDMQLAVTEFLNDKTDIYISAAAINDISFKNISSEKLRKNDLTSVLQIRPTVDILDHVIKKRSKRLKIIGFAAETNLSLKSLNEKFKRKPVDLLIGTSVHNGLIDGKEKLGFATNSAQYFIMGHSLKPYQKEMSKENLSQEILTWVNQK